MHENIIKPATTVHELIKKRIRVKVIVCSPDIPVGSSNFYINRPPGIETHSFTVWSTCGECCTISYSCGHTHSTSFCSTWYPLLLGGQRQCGFNAYRRLLHVTTTAGIEPSSLGLESNALTTWPHPPCSWSEFYAHTTAFIQCSITSYCSVSINIQEHTGLSSTLLKWKTKDIPATEIFQ